MGQDKEYRAGYHEQYENVLQLARDRKNGIGGFHSSIKDFSEMGPPQGGNWPFSAESIRRAFGVPIDRGDPDTDYRMTRIAQTHILFERTLQGYLAIAHPAGFAAINEIFDPDSGGDRDWEWWQKKAKRLRDRLALLYSFRDSVVELMQKELPPARKGHLSYDICFKLASVKIAKAQNLPIEYVEQLLEIHPNRLATEAARTERLVLQAEAGLVLMTIRLLREELFVQYAERRTIREEDALNKQHTDLYLSFKELTQELINPDTGKHYTTKEAYEVLHKQTCLSRVYMEQIVAGKRQEIDGLEPRKQGRPKKQKTS